MIEVIQATAEHAVALSGNLREADRLEVTATYAADVGDILLLSVALSSYSRAIVYDGDVVGLFGVSPVSPGVGSPWLLCSDRVFDHQFTFLRRCRRYVRGMLSSYPLLTNHVDVRNAAAIAWLKWLGFTLDPETPYGAAQLPFFPFYMERPECVDL